MGLTVDGVKPLPPNSNRSPGRNQLGEDAAWTVKQAFRTATMGKLLLAFALAGVAQGPSVHRIPYWIEKGFDAQTVSFSFAADAGGAATMALFAGWLADPSFYPCHRRWVLRGAGYRHRADAGRTE